MQTRRLIEFYRSLQGGQFRPERQLQWLVDTPKRLAQYRELARDQHQICA